MDLKKWASGANSLKKASMVAAIQSVLDAHAAGVRKR